MIFKFLTIYFYTLRPFYLRPFYWQFLIDTYMEIYSIYTSLKSYISFTFVYPYMLCKKLLLSINIFTHTLVNQNKASNSKQKSFLPTVPHFHVLRLSDWRMYMYHNFELMMVQGLQSKKFSPYMSVCWSIVFDQFAVFL